MKEAKLERVHTICVKLQKRQNEFMVVAQWREEILTGNGYREAFWVTERKHIDLTGAYITYIHIKFH